MNRANRYWLQLKELEAKIKRVREIHSNRSTPTRCSICQQAWPCETMRELEEN